MVTAFDILGAINASAARFRDAKGYPPTEVSVSPESYRRLVELKAQENAIGNLVICSRPVRRVVTPVGGMSLMIDEMLQGTVEVQ